MSFRDRLGDCAGKVQARLDAAMAPLGELPVVEAMRWACGGGKRLRGFLVMEGAALHEVADARSVHAAAAIEALHAYSLVHDDLPCMDDDDLRRGLPTIHVKWDEATAVLAGDALQTLAFQLLSDDSCHPDPAVRIDMVATLARAAGAEGMVRGQALDIAAETAEHPLTLAEIETLQAGKTGALIRWSGEAGARLAQTDPAPLSAYADALGRAFQIADDILDVEGDATTAGKRVGKDAEAGKATFVSLLGLDGAKRRAAELVEESCAALDGYGSRAERLRDCARFVAARDR
ncbi:polyprenyl synthetase family protein [Tranquillimonas alkanivorans]|uniref:Geranylgeranyl diphosphate synthase n=1 Tax=Tranquillimonas alkanivorans TaxID=441119 RepID=A0A1I5U408_9RHOB|nr:farnesyl diphosphate synthase [Tranquillimonas alkanivorans]SFP89999.1 farnesyl diphosphate synthase [Tranquillimonas alkanivorans]